MTFVVAALISASLFVMGCSGGDAPAQTTPRADTGNTGNSQSQSETSLADKQGTYVTPEFRNSEFHYDLAETDGTMFIDTSAVSEGYVAAAGYSDARLKFQVKFGEETYNYDLASDGTPSVYPLQCGDGYYTFRVMENIVDSKYALAFETSADVAMYSEFEPYLRPNVYANYSESSECVKKAAEFASHADNMPELITQVYDFVCVSVTYDYDKAANIPSGYIPVPDETLSTGKGICIDYAALAASMLRSQGIPTKVIFGYVAPDDIYHAWNMFYTEDTGWVSVEFKVDEYNWNRLDLTFSANGSDGTFIGNGTNYADVYQY